MKNIFNKILLVAFAYFSFSCTKESSENFTDFAIVEGYLKSGDVFSVKVSRQVPFEDDVIYSSDEINNLDLNVVLNNQTYALLPIGEGVYVDSNLIVSDNDAYELSFNFDSKEVLASTYVPSKPLDFTQSVTELYIESVDLTTGPPAQGGTPPVIPDPIEFSWTNADNSYYLIVVENIESVLDPIVDFGDEEPPGNRFKKSPSNSNYEALNSREFQYFGMHRVILYHVLPDYAALYDETSTSSQNITNPSTSIVNGYGIFTGLNADTLYVDVIEQ